MCPAELPRALALLVTLAPLLGEITILEKTVKFTAKERCADGEDFRLIRRMKDDKPEPVATLAEVWTSAQERYTHRIIHDSALSFNLTSINFNDNGWYEFTCGGRVHTLIELEVVPPTVTAVLETESAELPCHSFTAGEPAGTVRWKRDGRLVAELDPFSGRIGYGDGFAGRVSVSPDYLLGDVSLTLKGATPGDQGDYICYGHDKDGNQKSVVRRLKVIETLPPCANGVPGRKMGAWTTVGIAAAAAVILGF